MFFFLSNEKHNTENKDLKMNESMKRVATRYLNSTYVLSPKDKRVIDAFVMGKPSDGKALSTDGRILEKVGIMSGVFARWLGDKIEVLSPEATKSDEVVLRYLIKSAGKGMVRFTYKRSGHPEPLEFSHGSDVLGQQINGSVWVKDGEKTVGALDVRIWEDDDEKRWSVLMVQVLPEYRRGGLATQMYKYMMKKFDLKPDQEEKVFRTEDGRAFRERARFAARG